jgi:hypothetical protein
MSLTTEYSIVNIDLQKKFEVQPMSRGQLPTGDLLQISVPNNTSFAQFQILIQAFMRASRLPFPESSYWASNLVTGVGLGTQSLLDGVARGLGGAVYEPYSGWTKQGFVGGLAGFGRGLGCLVYRPIKGGFDFIAQPIAGALNTPNFIYKQFAI